MSLGSGDQPTGNTPEAREVAVFVVSTVRHLPDEKRVAVMDEFMERMQDILSEGSHRGNTVHDLTQILTSLAHKHDF